MSRFNSVARNPRKTRNHEGGEAFTMTPDLELYSTVCTGMLQNKFYETANTTLGRIRELIPLCDPEFVCKLAVYAREKMYLRSIPLVLVIELLKSFDDGINNHNRDGGLLKRTVTRVIGRADEITEVLAYYQVANGATGIKKLGKLPNALKKGIANAFLKFDEYQFAKYNRDTEIKMRDALFLTHPKAVTKEKQKLFNKIVEGELSTPNTWETRLSEAGQQTYPNAEEKVLAIKNIWEDLIVTNKIGYMALLRNLRNILQAGIDDYAMEIVCSRLADAEQVAKSKQLPFRFFSAFVSLKDIAYDVSGWAGNRTISNKIKDLEGVDPFQSEKVCRALEDAIKLSVNNIQGFNEGTRVLIASDVSGSMIQPISAKSSVYQYDIGLLLGQLLQLNCHTALTGFFGNTFKIANYASDNVLENTVNLKSREGEVGYATNGYKVIQYLNNSKISVDKVMVFTDCQMYSSHVGTTIRKEWDLYRKHVNPDAKLYLFDLSGYKAVPLDVVADKNINLISGFSDKIFEVMDKLEKGEKTLDSIEDIVV